MALNAGLKLSPSVNATSGQDAVIGHILEETAQGRSMVGAPETEVLPFWINLIARVGSGEYAYGPNSITATEQGYHAMETSRRHVLSTHMMLGLVIMAAGFFQFWPAFRRRHRKAHRWIGSAYVLAALASMSMSAYFLVRTGVDETFNGFVFYAGLWFLLVLSVVSIGVALWAIRRGDVAAHLGWQALAFGCFLSAPIQRTLWVAMTPWAGTASFNEMNIAVNVGLFALCFSAGYLVFVVNRASAPLRRVPAASRAAWLSSVRIQVRVGVGVLIVALWALAAWLYLVAEGLAGSAFTRELAPAAAVVAHDTALGALAPWVVVAAMALFAGVSAKVLLATPADAVLSPTKFALLALSGGALALLYVRWGLSLGMPSHALSVAGVFYAALGALLMVFVALVGYGMRRGCLDQVREWLWFAIGLALAPGLLYGQFALLRLSGLIPDGYAHHGYQIAAAVALSLPIIAGHLLAVYSPRTRRHALS
ncbi:MAG: DUF2306 domain-containing protein [Oceanococcaceae bacterium]